jgi:hypothetical protein
LRIVGSCWERFYFDLFAAGEHAEGADGIPTAFVRSQVALTAASQEAELAEIEERVPD